MKKILFILLIFSLENIITAPQLTIDTRPVNNTIDNDQEFTQLIQKRICMILETINDPITKKLSEHLKNNEPKEIEQLRQQHPEHFKK